MRDVSPAERLRAIAREADAEVARIGVGVGVRVVMPEGTSDADMRAESAARLERRCADAAERCGNIPWWTP